MRVKEAIEEKELGITRPKNVSQESWQKAVDLYKAAELKGDAYPELTVAQAVLETGWFKSPSGRFNYFGQKASNSQPGTVRSTKEVSNGSFYNTSSRFRDYSNLDAALDDRLNKWGSKYKDAANVTEAISSIWRYDENKRQGVGYATDSHYDDKLKSILSMMGVPLTKEVSSYYDNPQNNPGSTTYAGADVEAIPEYEPKETLTNKTEVDNTAVANPYKDMYQGLLEQNNEILGHIKGQEEEKEATSKAQLAQQKLNEKVAQKEFLKELILKSGVQFVDRKKREQQPLDTPEANSFGYPSFEDGGKRPKVSDERMDSVVRQDATNVAPRLRVEDAPIFTEELPEVVITHDRSDYKDRLREEMLATLAVADNNVGQVKKNLNVTLPEGDILNEIWKSAEEPVNRNEIAKGAESVAKELNLEDYKTPEEVSELQQHLVSLGYDLGKYGKNRDGVDGKIGRKTKSALTAFNKDRSPEAVIQEVSAKEEERLAEIQKHKAIDKLVKNLEEPVSSSLGTKIIRGALQAVGVPNNAAQMAAAFTNSDSKVGQEDVDPKVMNHLRRSVLNAIERTGSVRGGTEYIDYGASVDKDLNSLSMDTGDMILGSLLSPELQAATIFGRVSYRQDPDTGEIEIYDTYDFSKTSEGDGLYRKIRNKAGKSSEEKLDKTPKLIARFNPNEEPEPVSNMENVVRSIINPRRLLDIDYDSIKNFNDKLAEITNLSGKNT